MPAVSIRLLWVATTLAGYRAARQRRFADHREWMIRSFALAFSIVANRPWSIVCILVFAPEALADRPRRFPCAGPSDRRRHLAELGGQPARGGMVAAPAPDPGAGHPRLRSCRAAPRTSSEIAWCRPRVEEITEFPGVAEDRSASAVARGRAVVPVNLGDVAEIGDHC